MALKAKPPQETSKRLKLFLFGDSGVGKTTAAVQFPRSYVFDCERGTDNYVDLFRKSKSVVLQTVSSEEIAEQLRELLTEKHDYRTVVLDPITTLEADIIERASARYEAAAKEGGDMRVWRDRDRFLKRVCNLLFQLDMTVIVTAHGKIDYGANMVKLGTTFDGWKRLPYMFDLVLELRRVGDKRMALVKKTRLSQFKDQEEFEFSYAVLSERYGAEILERPAAQITLASKEQVDELNRLIELVKLPEGTVDKWLSKAGVEEFADMTGETIAKCIDYVRGKLGK